MLYGSGTRLACGCTEAVRNWKEARLNTEISTRRLRSPSPAAERMRGYRKRRRDKMQNVRIELHVTDIDGLIRVRFLREEERGDPESVQTAVLGLLYWVLEDPVCSELIARQMAALRRRSRA